MLEFLFALAVSTALIFAVQYLRNLVTKEDSDGMTISTHPYIDPLAKRPVKNTGVQFMMKGRMY